MFSNSISLVRLLLATLYLNIGLKSALQCTMSHRCVQVGYNKTLNSSLCDSSLHILEKLRLVRNYGYFM